MDSITANIGRITADSVRITVDTGRITVHRQNKSWFFISLTCVGNSLSVKSCRRTYKYNTFLKIDTDKNEDIEKLSIYSFSLFTCKSEKKKKT